MSIAAAIACFTAAATLLGTHAWFAVQAKRLSAIVTAALAGYSLVLALSAESLASEFGEATYISSAGIFLVGTVSLLLPLTLGAMLLRAESKADAFAWNAASRTRHVRWSFWLASASLLLFYLGRHDLYATWIEERAEGGLTVVVATFLLLLSTSGIVSAFQLRRHFLAWTLLLVSGACFILSGSRAAVLAAVMLWLWSLVTTPHGRLRTALSLAGLGAFATLVHTALRFLRGLGIGGLIESIQQGALLQDFVASVMSSDLSGGESSIARYYVFATHVSSVNDFGFMTTVQRLALIAIPRINGFIDKPIDVTYVLWGKAFEHGLFDVAEGTRFLVASYLTGSLGSMHSTLFGELYISGGLTSLSVSAVVIGSILVMIDRYLRSALPIVSLALCGPVLVGYLMVARGNTVIGLGYFVYLGLLVALIRFVEKVFSFGAVAARLALTTARQPKRTR